jgi:type IV pilus assembly protein PilQ
LLLACTAALPVQVLPNPPVASEFRFKTEEEMTQVDKPSVERAMDYLLERLGPEVVPPAPAPGLPEALPPAKPERTGPAGGGSPFRAGGAGDARRTESGAAQGSSVGSALQDGQRGAAQAKPPRPIVKVDPEGSQKLTIHIQNGDLREVLDLLSEQGGLNILAGKEVKGTVSATLSGVDLESALEAILRSSGYTSRRQGKFIYVGTPEEFNNLEQARDRIEARVYRPNYVTAAELKALITPLLTEKVGTASVSSPAELGIAANDGAAGGDKYAGGDVVVVRDYQAVLAQVDQVVAEVDIRPMQVAIEAMILSVDLKDTDQFGVNFALLRNHLTFGWGSPPTLLSDVTLDQGLKFGYLAGDASLLVEALEQVADTNIIATPRLMVLNKHRAEILIGEKQGYVSTTVTETSTTQAVDFLETGTQLRLRPFVSRDGLIRLEIHPELSDGSVEVVNNFTLPNKTVTEVTTNIMVRDGCTVVIGGLMKEQLTNTTSAVPLLGSMPWVGPLFRNKTENIQRQEVIVLITPRIVYEPGSCREGELAACDYQRRQAAYAEKMSPLGRRSIARRYCRLAEAAWARQDRPTAMRLAELAVHFDPLNREAIDLRANICQNTPHDVFAPAFGSRFGTMTPGAPVLVAGGGLADGQNLADWMWEDLKRDGPAEAPTMPHPLDPGQPGTYTPILRPRALP